MKVARGEPGAQRRGNPRVCQYRVALAFTDGRAPLQRFRFCSLQKDRGQVAFFPAGVPGNRSSLPGWK